MVFFFRKKGGSTAAEHALFNLYPMATAQKKSTRTDTHVGGMGIPVFAELSVVFWICLAFCGPAMHAPLTNDRRRRKVGWLPRDSNMGMEFVENAIPYTVLTP
jgi:hypothetical protein